MQKLFSLIRSHLFISVFIVNTLRSGSKKMLLSFMSESVWPVFSSKSLTVSGLISRSLIHLEFIFVYGVRDGFPFLSFCSRTPDPHLRFDMVFMVIAFPPQYLLS